MKRSLAVLGALGAFAVVMAAAAATGSPAGTPAPPLKSVTTLVRLQATTSLVAAPPSALPPASTGATSSQTISGTVASTAGVSLSPVNGPTYIGTEPAQITITTAGSQTTVTVVPR